MTKFVFVTGGVVSGLGKGITAASLGRLLKQRNISVSAQKLDPYMNVDPGTMSPLQHGEVFVTDDGAETDLDLGHYERFIDESLSKHSNLTSGKVYDAVLSKERTGAYLGQTVQVIPHITDEIKKFIYEGANHSKADVLITEIGGTIGDIECQPFLEAIRQISIEKGLSNCLFIHVTLVPYLKGSNEHKSKPTQHSVKELRSIGINPNIIIARADEPINKTILEKIAMFCNVKPDCVIENSTLDNLYAAPIMLHERGLDSVVCRELNLNADECDLTHWRKIIEKQKNAKGQITVALVGKYISLHDAYLSVVEALNHAGCYYETNVNIKWVDSELIKESSVEKLFESVNAILIPGGFGSRGIEGKILACKYARENNIPFLGICLGMQIASIEFARNVCNIKDANSLEFDENCKNDVVHIMESQKNITQKGATMRLGSFDCVTQSGSLLNKLYNKELIKERHRHRFEFNNKYRDVFLQHGMQLSGVSPDGTLVECVELTQNNFFIAVQYHPEFKSRPNKAHPLFLGLVKSGLDMVNIKN